MKGFKITIITFFLIILVLGVLFFLYKENMSSFMNEKVSYDNRMLFNENERNMLNINEKDAKQMDNIEIITFSKYKKLEKNVPLSFIEAEVEVGQATTSSNFVKQYIFR
ncbi:hypothetical protein EOL94_04030 [bacterium]|nr:hypothetical protein [bacterium]